MISSRSNVVVFGEAKLTDVRVALQQHLQSIRWSSGKSRIGRDQELFDVWIHENAPGIASNRSTFELSIDQINRADVVIVLYTGEAGSAPEGSPIGICHAELQAAMARRPEIVYVVDLLPLRMDGRARDADFRRYVDQLSTYRTSAASQPVLHAVAAEVLQEAVAQLVRRGASAGSRKPDRGQALEWRQLDLADRQGAMRDALAASLGARPLGPGAEGVLHHLALPSGGDVAARLDAIPGATSDPAARERVGQPFLRDHLHVQALVDHQLVGPVHVIACQRGVTEAQALRMLGTPDAIAVPSDFGVYAADHALKIQLVLLANCTDVTAMAVAARRYHEWLVQTGEGARVLKRAQARTNILRAIAAQPTDRDIAPGATARPARPRRRGAPGR